MYTLCMMWCLILTKGDATCDHIKVWWLQVYGIAIGKYGVEVGMVMELMHGSLYDAIQALGDEGERLQLMQVRRLKAKSSIFSSGCRHPVSSLAEHVRGCHCVQH
jgi:hypothetical protein